MKHLILTLILALPVTAFAGDKPYVEDIKEEITMISMAQSQCHDQAMDNLSMKQCEAQAGEELDALLNREYKKIMSNPAHFDHGIGTAEILKKDFRNAQRAWIKFRDSNCNWHSNSFYGGTGQGLVYSGCINRMTKERITELVEHYYFD